MLRSESRSQSSISLKSDKSCTSMVKGSNDEEDMQISAQPQVTWPTYQENGQRKYGPPSWWNGPPPPKGTEVFLSRLHRQVLEDELCPILSTVGSIYTFRLMMLFSGANRGYGFVQYTSRESAVRAIKELNDYPIRPGSKMSVEESLDNCRLFIGRIPKDLTESKLKEILSKYLAGLKHVFLYMSPHNSKENRGFCFVEFEDHRSTAMGRRFLLCSGVPEWRSVNVTVDWAEPETEVPKSVMDKVTALYIRNLLITTTEEQIKQLLESITINCNFVTKIRKVKDFAFVHFANRMLAEYAYKNLDGAILDGMKILVYWAKPPSYRYKGEYLYGGNSIECSTESDSGSRRDSFGSTQGTSDSCNSSVLKGAPLFKRKEKTGPNKPRSELAPRYRNSSIGSCSSSNASFWESYKDDGCLTDRSITPTTIGNSYLNVSHSVVSSPVSHHVFVECLHPSIQGTYGLNTHPQVNAFDLNNSFYLQKVSHFENISDRGITIDDYYFHAATKVVSYVPDTDTNEFQTMKEIVSELLVKHSDCAYEVLKIIAEDFEWGTVFHYPLKLDGGWILAIRVKREGVIKNLVVLENLCETENGALNMAASKFLREYILDPKMFPITKILFFP